MTSLFLRYPRARDTVNVQDGYGNTCLHLASNTSVVKLLLEAGANPTITNKFGETGHAVIARLQEAEDAEKASQGSPYRRHN